ncbi:hypothetical protein BRD19_12150 [Halobacteriales archaeon SW_7_65_23]|nr:MAG: hypothetical protein BRD19_12150 [Halobacteriales archaeon SW_7_65_23]
MRLLVFHADSFTVDVPEADATADGAADAAEREDCLAAFVTVESDDETAPDAVVASARAELLDLAGTLRADSVVLYPTASLGDDPIDAETAGQVVAALEDTLRDGWNDGDDERAVVRAPMGWNTTFDLAAKAHPLAEQSRHITAADTTRDSPKAGTPEREMLFPDGTTKSLRAFSDDGDSASASETLRTLADRLDAERDNHTGGCNSFIHQSLLSAETDPFRLDSQFEFPRTYSHQYHQESDDSHGYWTAARESGLLAPEDSGTTTPRLTPQGTFVRDTVAEYVRSIAIDGGSVPITPATDATVADGSAGNLTASPPIRPAVLSALERMASTAPCPSVVLTATDVVAAGDGRPGQPAGAVRTPEVWTMATDRSAARAQLASQADMVRGIADACALETVPMLRVRASFAAENGAWLNRLVETLDEPMVVERRRGTRGEWPVALAFVAVVAGQPVETGTVWLRPGDARVAGEGAGSGEEAMAPGALLCCTPVGPLERATATVGAMATTRDPPRLPTWLAPTQVRLVPTDPDEFRERCREIAAALEANGVRVDVDDRDLSVGERLDRADADWLPYDAVVGGREADGKTLAVTVRETGEQIDLTAPELGDRIHEEVGDRPRKRLYLPKFLSERAEGFLRRVGRASNRS